MLLGLASVLALAACGGGGSSPNTVTPVIPVAQGKLVTPQFTIVIPAKKSSAKRRPEFVSTGTASITITLTSVGGNTPTVTPTSVTTNISGASCSSGCTVGGPPSPPGQADAYTLVTFDGNGGAGNQLDTGSVTFTPTVGINNAASLTMHGIPVTVTVSGSTLVADVALGSESLTVDAYDADSNLIVGTASYSNPITLTDNDATGITSLGGSASVVVTGPTTAVSLNYNGQAVNNFTITASGTGISGGGTIASTVYDVTFTAGTTNDDAANGGLATDANWGQQTVFLGQAAIASFARSRDARGVAAARFPQASMQVVTAAEAGFTDAPYSQQFTVTPDAGCASVASVSPNPGPNTSFTITQLGAGLCHMKLAESGTGYPITQHAANVLGSPTHDGTFWVSVCSTIVAFAAGVRPSEGGGCSVAIAAIHRKVVSP